MAGLGLILWATMSPAFAAPAPAVSLDVRKEGAAYHLVGSFSARASDRVAWEVLTDYGGLARFVSTMRKSRVLGRTPDGLVVEQEGVGSFLFFSKSVRLRLAVREEPPDRIYFEQVGASPFDLYEGHWVVTREPAGCSVVYDLDVEPRDWMGPSFVARKALLKNIARQLDEVKAEMERRARVIGVAAAREAGHEGP